MKVYRGATILDGTGRTYNEGDLLINGEKIAGIGNNLDIPEEAEIVDVEGKWITPGLIDVHTHLGVHESGLGSEGSDFNETSEPTTPHIRAIDGLNPLEKGFQDAREAGVTATQVMPGSANVIGGEMLSLKTSGSVVDQMAIQTPSAMKGALGENPKRVYSGKNVSPMTRMGVSAVMRQTFMQAQDYLHKKESGELKERNLRMEQLIPVLKREIPFRTHAHRADDILTSLRIAEEFQLWITIEHCTEGHLIIEQLQKAGVHVSVGPTMSTRSKVELSDRGYYTMVEMEKYHIPFSITTDHPVIGIDYLTTAASHAVKHGVSETTALKAITSQAASHIGAEDRIGSLEEGKDADFVVWSDHPFHPYTNVLKTFIEGTSVYSHPPQWK